MNQDTPSTSRWRPVAALLAALALVLLLVGRATGMVGGDDEIVADEAPSEPSSSADAGEPAAPPADAEGEPGAGTGPATTPSGRPSSRPTDGKPSRPGGGLPEALATDVPGGGDLARRVKNLLSETDAAEPAIFRVSSLNVLGASHTTARGNKPRYASGVDRMAGHVQMLRSLDIDVVGLQEFEMVQYQTMKRLTGDDYGVYPGPSLGRGPIRNSVAWRQDRWELVDARTIPIPYFRGKRVPMPYVLLKHRDSGQAVYFINIHNPTSNKKRGNNERWRDLGTKMEIALAKRLNRSAGVPVVLMGDFNERTEAFCRVTGAGLVAANGGRPGRPCVPPANAGIDWIFGTRDLEFSDYVRLDSAKVNRLTDHPMLLATVRAGG